MQTMRFYRMVLCTLYLTLLSGCASDPEKFHIKKLAKSDVDLVADIHRRSANDLLKTLHFKLYRRNPAELKKSTGHSAESRWAQLSQLHSEPVMPDELGNAQGIKAIHLAFAPDYQGDRVFALMAGLNSMLSEAYSHKQEFYWLDSLNQQKLYNSARNVEVLVWMLRTKKHTNGQPLILTDSMDGEAVNLSFERLFGKLIAQQDLLALVVADKTQRTINTVTHSVASMTLIPL